MGNRQDKTLGPGIHQAETQFVVMMGTVHRVLLDVVQRIVHPPHVPFVGEPEPALLGALTHPRPRRGFLGNHQGTRCFEGDHVVEVTHEIDGLEVFPTAVAVRHPLAGLARIIAVEHRRHRIHPQAVDVEVLEPVQRRGQHKAVHLGAPEVVDQGVPVLVETFQRVAVLIQRRAIELCQAMGIRGKMRRHPVEDHADFSPVAGIDKGGEIGRAAITRTRRELRQRLITPGTAERMLHDRHQFDMGEAQLLDIGNQPIGQLAPAVLAGDVADFIDLALPGAGMQLIDRQRCIVPMPGTARLHPGLVLPVEAQGRSDARSGVRRQLGGQGHGVGLERQDRILAENLVFVGLSRLQARHKDFPDTAGVAQAHRMPAPVPDVEITDHRNPSGIRRPDRKTHAVDAVDLGHLGAETAAQVTMVAFGEQVEIHLAEQRPEAVGVFADLLPRRPLDTQQIGLALGEMTDKQPRHISAVETAQNFLAVAGQGLDTQGTGQEGTDILPSDIVVMGPEDGKRVMVFGPHQSFDILLRGQCTVHRFTLFLAQTHHCSPPDKVFTSLNNPLKPCNGTQSQVGRFSAS